MSKKHKFDLTRLVHEGALKDGQVLYFVSDPKKTCKIARQPNGEFKITAGAGATAETLTIHAFAQRCLGQDPPDHASRWFRTQEGRTLYELWHADEDYQQAA